MNKYVTRSCGIVIVLLLIALTYYFVHMYVHSYLYSGAYYPAYESTEFKRPYDMDSIKDHFKQFKLYFERIYKEDIKHDIDIILNSGAVAIVTIEGCYYLVHVSGEHTFLFYPYFSEGINNCKGLCSSLGCPIRAEYFGNKGWQFYVEVPLELMQFFVSIVRGTLQHIFIMGSELNIYTKYTMYSIHESTNYSLLYFIHSRLPLLLFLLFIILVVLYTGDAIGKNLLIFGVVIILILCVGSACFYYEVLNLGSYSDSRTFKIALTSSFSGESMGNGLPNYSCTKYYGIKHICINVDFFKHLKFPMGHGYSYIIVPNTHCTTLNAHFIEYGNLDRVKGLIVYEGFPLYYKDHRIYVKVPLEYFIQLDHEFGKYLEDPFKYHRSIRTESKGYFGKIKNLLRYIYSR